jgi:hypothetical protein
MKTTTIVLAAVLGLVCTPLVALATLHAFRAEIDGAQEVPPCPPPDGSASTGVGRITLDDATGVLTYDIAFSVGDLSSPENAAHFHHAPPGMDGPIIVPLPLGSPKMGMATLTPAQQADLLAGNYYVNIHTDDCPGGEIRGQVLPTAVAPGDHYHCYKGGLSKGEPKFTPETVTTVDQFTLVSSVEANKVQGICNPAQKNDEPGQPVNPTVHQGNYKVKAPRIPYSDHVVIDQFGRHEISVRKVDGLLVRSAKALGSTPPPTTGIDDSGVDNFLCYKVVPKKGTPKFTPVLNVEVEDQFGSRNVDVKKIRKLCNPVDKQGEDPDAPTHPGHLLCYQSKLSKGEAKFTATQVAINNTNFGPSVVDAKKIAELCVPACKDESAPCGSPSGAFLDDCADQP